MFKKALAGVDVSPAEAALLSCLPDLRHWGIETLVLAHVLRIGYVEGAGYGHEDEYRKWLEEHAAPLRAAGLTVTVSVPESGDPAEALLAEARSQGADLIVVGSRSHNFLHDVFLGSVAKRIIHKSDIPVLIQRLEPTQAGAAETCAAVCSRTLERILLATDLSAQSSSAEDAAVHLAANAGHVDCLTVLADEAGEADRQAAEARHRQLIQNIEEAGGTGGSRIEQGDPSEVIVRIGGEGYSLIIVGKHGRHRIEDRIVGSACLKLCEIARRPVLMVPLRKG